VVVVRSDQHIIQAQTQAPHVATGQAGDREPYVGRPVPGLTAPLLVQGAGTYVDDVAPPGCLHAVLVRSPHARAAILGTDTTRTRALPGVVDVVTDAELWDGTEPRTLPLQADATPLGAYAPKVFPLARGRVKYVGEPVAVVVAEDRFTAAAAADLVTVEYAVEAPVLDSQKALLPGAPLVEPDWPDNLMLDEHVETGDVAAAFAEADGIAAGELRTDRLAASPLEPRGIIADWEPRSGRLTVHAATQTPHPLRAFLAEFLGLPTTAVRVVAANVGGGFGAKLPLAPEEVLIPMLTRRLARPVKWIEERREQLGALGHSRDMRCRYRVAFRAGGTVTGLETRLTADLGIPSAQVGRGMAVNTFLCMPGPYRVPNLSISLAGAVTNKAPWQAYRGFGKEAAAFFMDRIMDHVADHTGVDRAQVRLCNFIPADAFPAPLASGPVLDSGDYAACLGEVLERVDVSAFRAEQARARAQGRLLGLGFGQELTPEGVALTSSLFNGVESATVRIGPDGAVEVFTGVSSAGTGNETGIAQVVADALGCRLERVTVRQGDTDLSPQGSGNYSSRSLTMGGAAAAQAADTLRKKLLRVAASMLEAKEDDLMLADGRIEVAGDPDTGLALDDVVAEIHLRPHGPHLVDVEPGLEAVGHHRAGNVFHRPAGQGRFSTYPTWSNASAAAVVEVDAQTGVVTVLRYVLVHDSGVVVNPMLADAQLQGAVVQGLGAALYETIGYGPDGAPTAESFMHYTLPSVKEAVAVELGHRCSPSPFTPLGTKGVGESGISAPPGAIASAIEDALAPLRIRLTHPPFTPSKVWEAIAAAQASPARDPGAAHAHA
jgi:aerobic carbon-monoxide dehydrogenase large subunit